MTTFRLLTLEQQATTARQLVFSIEYEAFVAQVRAKAFPNDPELAKAAADLADAVVTVQAEFDATVQLGIDAGVIIVDDDLEIHPTGTKIPVDKGGIVIPDAVADTPVDVQPTP